MVDLQFLGLWSRLRYTKEQIPYPNGKHASPFSGEASSSLMARTLKSFRNMKAIIEAVGIISILTIELICYLGMGKLHKMRFGV